MAEYVISAMYKFVTLEDFESLRAPIQDAMEKFDIRGTLLLAKEGVNGTVAGKAEGMQAFWNFLKADARLSDIVHKESYEARQPFRRAKVKLKKEIVTMGVEGIDPRHVVGTYVKPKDWNALISDPEVFVVDTRNDYEVELGTFKGAVDPDTKTFREFPDYVKQNMDPAKHRKVAMFCTGGIRCEKSTAYMKEQGFDEVYHLEGGILKYLEEVPQDETLWEGECFVFDDRVTVDHSLERGNYEMCRGCRMPITQDEMQSDKFEMGVSCPKCHDSLTEEQKGRFREREKQMKLSELRGETHIGKEATDILMNRRKSKQSFRDAQRAKSKAEE